MAKRHASRSVAYDADALLRADRCDEGLRDRDRVDSQSAQPPLAFASRDRVASSGSAGTGARLRQGEGLAFGREPGAVAWPPKKHPAGSPAADPWSSRGDALPRRASLPATASRARSDVGKGARILDPHGCPLRRSAGGDLARVRPGG